MLPDSSVRLNKYISESGICSRREADRYIEQGNVFLNGKRATIGDQVKPGDVVKVNGQLIEPREAEDLVLIALNKPVGIVSTTEDGERDNIVDFVNHSKRVFPIGRLDMRMLRELIPMHADTVQISRAREARRELEEIFQREMQQERRQLDGWDEFE